MAKRCRECGSTRLEEVNTELSFAPKKAEQVYSLGKMTACLECGFAEYRLSEEPLAQLRQCGPAELRGSSSDRHASTDADNSTFDIWSGTPQKTGKWLDTVTGLAEARKRMAELAAQTPGPYFIFSAWNRCILDQIDTREQLLAVSAKATAPSSK
jgi:hypothetical protein